MRSTKSQLLFFSIIILLALVLRLPRLAQRPMHTDEAVHAIKFGQLLEKNDYRYDPFEYHGPTLNYFTLLPACVINARKLTEINEFTLRIVPVIFSVLLIVLLWWLRSGLSWTGVLAAAFLTAISPGMVYYSRYYIMEIMLVCFTLGAIAAGFKYFETRKAGWARLTGIFLGLMHATKETCIITFGTMFLALFIVYWLANRKAEKKKPLSTYISPTHILLMLASGILVSILFFSSFFTHPQGIWDSVKTYTTYLNRAGGNTAHLHPWYYYLQILIFYHKSGHPFWSDALILILAIAGIWISFSKKQIPGLNRNLARFLSIYTILMTVIYSAIPYKTPWSMLSFFHGWILLAGIGLAAILEWPFSRYSRMFMTRAILIGIVLTGVQTYLANFKYEADPVNPYVYAHTSPDIFKVVKRVKNVAKASPAGKEIYIEVICPGGDYWPLPWYLRAYPNVGWWQEVNLEVPAAPIIICQPAVEPALIEKLYEIPPPGERHLYVPLFSDYTELRPGVELRGYVRRDLWVEE